MSLRLKYRDVFLALVAGACLLSHPLSSFSQTEPLPATQTLATANTPQAWVDAAKACADSLCHFSALQRALRLDGRFRPALLDLAGYYSARHQRAKARDILQNLIASDPRDFIARKQLGDLLLEIGDRQHALDEYSQIENAIGHEHGVKNELAAAYQLAGALDRALPLAKAAFEENPLGATEQEQLLRLQRERRDGPGILATLSRMVTLDPHNTKALVQLADAQAAMGDVAAAEKSLRAALESEPNDVEACIALHDLLSSVGRTDEAAQQLTAIAALNAADDIRRRLEWSGEAAPAAADPDASYLAAFSVDQLPPAPAQSPKAVALSDVRIERVALSGLATTRVQQFFLLTDQQGAREYGSRSVQYAPATESLHILHARLHKPDGRTIDAEDDGETSVADTKAGMYYDVRARKLLYKGAEPGDVVELDYRVKPETDVNAYGDYYGSVVLMQGPVAAQLKRYVLITPADRAIHATERRIPSPPVAEIAGGNRVQQWEMRDVAALPNEPRGLSATDAGAYVSVSTFDNWTDLGRWYAAMLRPQLELDPALQSIAQNFREQYPDDHERIRAIHRFVLQNTHYVAFEFGIYGYKPYPASQVYSRRFGDCKDKAGLMIALLRATGIEAQLALVRTRRLGGFAAESASVAHFNHAIAYLPDYDLYLDGTAEYAGARELPLEDQGAIAFTVGLDGQSAIRQIPVTAPSDNHTHRTVNAEIRRDASIEFTGTAATRGEDAPGLRREYENPGRQRESFRQGLAELFPTVRVENVEVQGAHDLERDVEISFRGVLDSFTGRNELTLSNSWIPRRYVQTLAPLATRTQPLLLPAGWGTEEELHFQLPSDSASTELPRELRLETPFGSAHFTYTREAQQVTIHTHVEFTRTRIEPYEYPAFREFCRAIDSGFRDEVKVKLP